MGWADFCLNSARGFHLPAEHALSSSRLRSAFALWRASASVSRPRSEDSEALRMQVFTPHRVYAVLNLAPLHRGCKTPNLPPVRGSRWRRASATCLSYTRPAPRGSI